MPNTVTITIDGENIEVDEGSNVLQAALDAGICIPNLCFLPDMCATGACRVCIVELTQDGRTKMTAACTLEAKEGMIIDAHSESANRARRNIVELLLAEAPRSAVLQCLAERLEIDEIRYEERDSDCVLCGRCVTACAEIAGAGVKGFISRGIERHVGLPFYKDELCQKCYECKDRCPLEIAPHSRRGPSGVCGSELSKNEDLIPEICERCMLD